VVDLYRFYVGEKVGTAFAMYMATLLTRHAADFPEKQELLV
jgi:hypothetical protein